MPQTEKRALKLNIAANGLFAAGGFGFALSTRSEAILVDGIYSLITLAFAVVSWRVADLVMRPDNERYPFGYVLYEPIVNLFKGLLLFIVAVYAFFSSISALMSGGTPIHTELAFFYALAATAGCASMGVYFRSVAKQTGSALVETDARNWLIDTALSASVAFAFGLSWLLSLGGHTHYLNYVDPIVVTFLAVLILPVPARIIRDNWSQIVARSPADELVAEIEALLEQTAPASRWPEREVRIQQYGRLVSVHVYFVIAEGTVQEFDRCRAEIDRALKEHFPFVAMDISFVTDIHWARRASGDE
jgi:cation diffusion facilitator family transporter